MNIIYFVIGNSCLIHMQVKFSLRTILAQAGADDTLYVVTDSPQLYAGLPQTKVIPLSQQDIAAWKGTENFFWRVKMMAIKRVIEEDDTRHVMYLDGDTFLFGKLSDLKGKLDAGIALMHKDEGSISQMPGKSRQMWEQTQGRTYDGITIEEHLHMWNAGVVAIPQTMLHCVIDQALNICDGMLRENVEPIVVEQYSLSITLQRQARQLIPASPYIGHYWHEKQMWCKYIAQFFTRSYCQGLSLQDEINALRQTDLRRTDKKLKLKRRINKITGLDLF